MDWGNFETAGGKGVAKSIWDLFGKDKNPADAANQQLDQIPGTVKPYYDPYINAGTGALPGYQQQLEEMMKNPQAIIDRLGAGYKESPGFQFNKNQALTGIGNAAAAGGMAGSPEHEQRAGQLAENLSSQDYDKYLNQVLGLFGGGVQGNEGLVKQGYGASSDLATTLANMFGAKAQYGYAGAADQNRRRADDRNQLFSGLGTAAQLAMGA